MRRYTYVFYICMSTSLLCDVIRTFFTFVWVQACYATQHVRFLLLYEYKLVMRRNTYVFYFYASTSLLCDVIRTFFCFCTCTSLLCDVIRTFFTFVWVQACYATLYVRFLLLYEYKLVVRRYTYVFYLCMSTSLLWDVIRTFFTFVRVQACYAT